MGLSGGNTLEGGAKHMSRITALMKAIKNMAEVDGRMVDGAID